ncbi:MAG: 1-hydroxycarotenoid 3,4-desaturase CrtD [Pseudomonadota bacterium]
MIGAGVGGLAAAAALAQAGHQVSVFERAAEPGGKMRQLQVAGAGVDAGPTVFTMRWVFDQLFEGARKALEQAVELQPASVLARHAWTDGGTLDLHASEAQSADAIAAFASAADARGYLAFCQRGREVYDTLRDTFMHAQRPTPIGLARRVGFSRPQALWRTAPHRSLWAALEDYFPDPRLRQLFGRYSTYVGSSPLQTPATLMLIAHVEQSGVWLINGGMRALAVALQRLGEERGATYHFTCPVSEICVNSGRVSGLLLEDGRHIDADHVVYNGDVSALAAGLLGDAMRRVLPAVPRQKRGLSAVTWCLQARTEGFPLHYHNVFFARDYAREFKAIFGDRDIVDQPTVYVCAQDRLHGDSQSAAERLLILINAPADGDIQTWSADKLTMMRERALAVMSRCGLSLTFDESACQVTSPADFAELFPGSGGSLYGRASHGMFSSFVRPGARSPMPGLYLAGGSVHPGPGVPMAALSGRLAAAALQQDLAT